MDREGLLGREDEAWAAFSKAFTDVPRTVGTLKGSSRMVVKDLVWHCGYWADYVGDVLERMSAGHPSRRPGLGRAQPDGGDDGKAKTWDEVVVAGELGRDRARQALIAIPRSPTLAASEFSDETFDHYDEHTAEIVAFRLGRTGAKIGRRCRRLRTSPVHFDLRRTSRTRAA
jgi:hypothetical protein